MADEKCEFSGSAAEFVPRSVQLKVLAAACQACRGCQLYCNATQAVFGEGPRNARIMFVGEQPGDQEDRAGRPFVGPAGKLFDSILESVGIDRQQTYVTNAVKHFKFEQRGKRRIHSKPSAREAKACRPWLEAEIASIKPQILVCLGSIAAQSLLGRDFRVTRDRGKWITGMDWAPNILGTVHPSAVLRAPDDESRRDATAAFEADLRKVAKKLLE